MKTLIENRHYRRAQREAFLAEGRASQIKCRKKNEPLGGKMEKGRLRGREQLIGQGHKGQCGD